MLNLRGLLVVALVAAAWLAVGLSKANAEQKAKQPLDLTRFTTVDHARSGNTNGRCTAAFRRNGGKGHDLEKVCPLRPRGVRWSEL